MLQEVAKIVLDSRLTLHQVQDMVAVEVIREALARFHGNQCQTAKALGVHRNTLNRRIHYLKARGFNIRVAGKPVKAVARPAARAQTA